jgi:Protein of unknown function (DUF1549)/Protein of unknown function (DUF1553)
MIRIFLSVKTRFAAAALVLTFSGSLHAQLARKEANLGNDPAYIKKTALEIDKRMGAGFQRAKVAPVTPADDAKWLRRVYLDAVGRIPSYDEARAFLADTAADKREKLVDKLLNSEGYVSHTYNYYADILRATSRLGSDDNRSGVPYLRWLRESVATNKPWDKMTFELLTSTGGGWEPGKGAVGYFERDRGMPLDNMANTTRIFLGTHMECAQCHDHPYDKWKQTDFYEMAAFTHGLKTGSNSEQKRYVNEKYDGRDNLEQDRTKRDIYRWLMDNIYDFGVYGDGKGNIPLPMDFKEKGGKPGEVVPAKAIFPGARGNASRDMKEAREKFAEWMTSPQNPRFTLIITNRLWKRVMGVGMFEPVDKFQEKTNDAPGTVISNPAAMEYLQTVLKELNYDVKAFQKVLFNTRTYALGTNTQPVDTKMPYAFHGRVVRRMSAEQVWDSMTTLVIPDVDYRKGNALDHTAIVAGRNLGKSVYDVWKEVINMKPAEITAWVDNAAKTSSKGGSADMMMDKNMMSTTDSAAAGMTDGAKWNGYNAGLVRAAELRSPTPPEHFLRKFGQSSREVIEGASNESDVTQVLSLINGHVEKNIIGESRAVVYKAVDAAGTPEEKVKAAFLAILTRYPTPAEMDLMLPEAKKGRDGIKNIIYALLNTNEFIFIL